jgi:hypothetical protein
MRWQFITMKMGMGCVLWGKGGFFNGFMRGMRQGMSIRMMPGIFQVTFPVLAGPGFERRICPGFLFL